MKLSRSNKLGLIGGLFYISLGAISLASYFMGKRNIKVKSVSCGKSPYIQAVNSNAYQNKTNILQN
ncbi:MAG: hypothetical protein ACM3MI_09715 [Clostridiales bacterium]